MANVGFLSAAHSSNMLKLTLQIHGSVNLQQSGPLYGRAPSKQMWDVIIMRRALCIYICRCPNDTVQGCVPWLCRVCTLADIVAQDGGVLVLACEQLVSGCKRPGDLPCG